MKFQARIKNENRRYFAETTVPTKYQPIKVMFCKNYILYRFRSKILVNMKSSVLEPPKNITNLPRVKIKINKGWKFTHKSVRKPKVVLSKNRAKVDLDTQTSSSRSDRSLDDIIMALYK